MMNNQNQGLYDKYKIINRETGREVEGNLFVLKPGTDPAARSALLTYAAVTDNRQLAIEINAWISTLPDILECDWCGEPAAELSHPHMFDPAIGRLMCRGCWDHDREVYKGSYGEDIGEFRAVKVQENHSNGDGGLVTVPSCPFCNRNDHIIPHWKKPNLWACTRCHQPFDIENLPRKSTTPLELE